ncbi:MAG: hypothetical protein II329_00905 [Clostridia bacterium]|nr:hypothetical protein [Clostridia bacterium]
MKIFKQRKSNRRIEGMSTHEKANMIKRLERERRKINSEIEGILKSYAKESGNRAVKPKKLGFGSLDDLFISYGE